MRLSTLVICRFALRVVDKNQLASMRDNAVDPELEGV